MAIIKFQSKPFDQAHAKAGAPYCCADSHPAVVVKFDVRNEEYPLMGYLACESEDIQIKWSKGGFADKDVCDAESCNLVMPPLGYTDDGKPVWTGDMIIEPGYPPHPAHPMQRVFSGMTFPEPAKVYPETLASPDLLSTAYMGPQNDGMVSAFARSLQAVANAAIRHAIDAGQVIVPEDTKRADAALCKAENALEAIGWRLKDGEWYNAYSRHFYGEIGGIHMTGEKADIKAVADLCAMRDAIPAREMAIAKAVEQIFINARYSIPGEDGIDLAAIIASVKP